MKNRLKILYVLDCLNFGGVERNTINLANKLAESHDVSILTLTDNHMEMKNFISDKVCYYSLGSKHVLLSVVNLVRFLKAHKFDGIISAKEYVNVTCLIAGIFAGDAHRIITSTRTNLSFEKLHSRLKLFKFYLLMAKILYPIAKANVSVSKGVADDLKKVLGLRRNSKVIYNPATKEESLSLTPKVPHPWLSERRPVIIGCGRLTKQKDFQLLIDAFSFVVKEKEVRLIILGEGKMRSELEEQIKKLNLEDKVWGCTR